MIQTKDIQKIGVVVAMDSEYELVTKAIANSNNNTTNDLKKEIIVKKSGIGKVNASLTVAELIDKHNVDAVLSTGVAGGLDSSLTMGDVVIGIRYAYHDVWCGEPNAWGQVQGLPPFFEATLPYQVLNSEHYQEGLIVTGDQFVTEAEKLKDIKSKFKDALACDMESAAIAQTCFLKNIPFVSIRVISDVAGKEAANEAQYAKFWQEVPQKSFALVSQIIQNI